VRCSSRYDGYSWSGAANEPLETPAHDWTMCVWQLEGQCWMRSVHVSADAGSVPSYWSVAEPENEMGSPTRHVSVGDGVQLVAVAVATAFGGRFGPRYWMRRIVPSS